MLGYDLAVRNRPPAGDGQGEQEFLPGDWPAPDLRFFPLPRLDFFRDPERPACDGPNGVHRGVSTRSDSRRGPLTRNEREERTHSGLSIARPSGRPEAGPDGRAQGRLRRA